ncbi:hypothetical protein VNO77_07387 [Canavalia gladiata]|uniref:Uncharacterized protein n=1 Tax=Canavalia gladiata TaxID=3824 RepID=A0AAN9M8E8_CANGL
MQTIKKVAALRSQKRVSDGEGFYLQNRGLGVALLSMTTNAKVRISPFVATLTTNSTFVSGLLAWVIAQSIKQGSVANFDFLYIGAV